MVLFAVEASAVSSGRPCGVYMFSGLTTLVINIYNITEGNIIRNTGRDSRGDFYPQSG